jgi:phage terminase small subunit
MQEKRKKSNEKTTKKLTPKEESFAQWFVKLGSAADAYRKAYQTNASNSTIGNNAYVVLNKPHVKERVRQLAERAETLTVLTAQQILDRLTRIAEKKSLQARDRLKALELLGKYRKLFTDKMELKGADGQAIVVASLSERLKDARERSRIGSLSN